MSKAHKGNRDASVNSAIQGFHDDLKSLALTCAPVFPKHATGGLKFLTDVTDLQGIVASYHKQLLVRLFQSAGQTLKEAPSIVPNASGFIALWEDRRKLRKKERRSEKEIDAAIRRRIKSLLKAMYFLGEDELRAFTRNEDIPGMLYYLSTVEAGLNWYAGRYLARMTGELAKVGR
jgi:hypothetical protein